MDKNGETYGIGILYGKSIGKNSEHIGEPHIFLDKHHDEKAFWWKNYTGPDENLAVTPRSSRQFLLTTALKPSQKSMSYAGEASASRTPVKPFRNGLVERKIYRKLVAKIPHLIGDSLYGLWNPLLNPYNESI